MKLHSPQKDESDGHWLPPNASIPAYRIIPLKWNRIPGQDFEWSCLCHMPTPGPVTAQTQEALQVSSPGYMTSPNWEQNRWVTKTNSFILKGKKVVSKGGR